MRTHQILSFCPFGVYKDIDPKPLEIDERICHFLTSEIECMEFLIGGERDGF
jgi:hypothetical protein